MTLYHYLGKEDETVLQEVEELLIHPSVQELPDEMCFFRFRRLIHVDLNGCDSMTKIGRLAFGWCNLIQTIEIPFSVSVIEEGAFESCISLETVVFCHDQASSLITIGERAFNCCESLKNVAIPSSVEVLRESAFRRCSSMTEVSFAEGLKVIGSGAFQECVVLEQVELPKTLETLGSEAFRECSSLWGVRLSEGLNEIGSRAFYGCCALSVVKMVSSRITMPTNMDIEDEKHMTYEPEPLYTGVSIIGEYSFCGCEALTSIALPPSVTDVQRGAFQDCSNLISVEVSERGNDLNIEYFAFYCCESLVNISLPAITTEGFGSCTLLCNQYGVPDLPDALMHRFDAYPIHNLCYHASVTTTDELIQEIQRNQLWIGADEDGYKNSVVDPFGMTPFHILLSSANGRNRMDLLHILLLAFPPHVLGWKDTFGMLAVEYCLEYEWHEDTRRMIRMILRRWMVGSIERWGGLESWKHSMSNHIERFLAEDDEDESNQLFSTARTELEAFEILENTSLLELSLWKMALLNHTLGPSNGKDDRETCRIQCGASVLLPNVTPFLL